MYKLPERGGGGGGNSGNARKKTFFFLGGVPLPFITGGATITPVLTVGALGVPELGQLHQVGHHSWGGRKVVFRERKSKTRFTLTSLRGQ